MGVSSDLVICTEGEAKSGKVTDTWPKGNDRIELKGVTSVELATLGEVLELWTFDAALELIGVVYENDESEGPLLYEVPKVLVDRLNALESSVEIDAVVDRWAATDEYQNINAEGEHFADAMPRDDVKFIVETLMDAAAHSEAEGKPLYLWNAL